MQTDSVLNVLFEVIVIFLFSRLLFSLAQAAVPVNLISKANLTKPRCFAKTVLLSRAGGLTAKNDSKLIPSFALRRRGRQTKSKKSINQIKETSFRCKINWPKKKSGQIKFIRRDCEGKKVGNWATNYTNYCTHFFYSYYLCNSWQNNIRNLVTGAKWLIGSELVHFVEGKRTQRL